MKDREHEECVPAYEDAKRTQANVRVHLDAFNQSRLRAVAPVLSLALLIAFGAGGATSLLGPSAALVGLAAIFTFTIVLFVSLVVHARRIRRAQKRAP